MATHVPVTLDRRGLRDRFSLEGLDASRTARAVLGLLLTAMAGGGITLILLLFTGHFTNVVTMDAQVSGQGNAVQVGSPVEYRNVTVGKVVTESPGPGGHLILRLDMYRSHLDAVPSGVTASIAPLSIFGNQYVDLNAPAKSRPGHLVGGDFIPADAAAPSNSLQGTVSQLYNLITAVHPADLDTALNAFATALRGEGANLGKALDAASAYLGDLVPHLSTLNSDVKLLAPVTNDVNAAAPNLLGILHNSEVTGPTISSEASQVSRLLTGGATVSNQSTSLATQVASSYPTLVNEASPILADISANPNELSQTLSGLAKWAAAWAASETHGPYVEASTNLPIANINAAVEAALGYNATQNVAAGLGSAVNPPTYTAADCPTYASTPNPYCGTGGSPAATPVGPSTSSTSSTSSSGASGSGSTAAAAAHPASPAPAGSSSTGSAAASAAPSSTNYQEQQALETIAAGLDQGHPSPGVTTMLLYSLFASASSGS